MKIIYHNSKLSQTKFKRFFIAEPVDFGRLPRFEPTSNYNNNLDDIEFHIHGFLNFGPEKCLKEFRSRVGVTSQITLVQIFLFEMNQSWRFEQLESECFTTCQIATLFHFQTARICNFAPFRREKMWNTFLDQKRPYTN